jgi:hypothetical protein
MHMGVYPPPPPQQFAVCLAPGPLHLDNLATISKSIKMPDNDRERGLIWPWGWEARGNCYLFNNRKTEIEWKITSNLLPPSCDPFLPISFRWKNSLSLCVRDFMGPSLRTQTSSSLVTNWSGHHYHAYEAQYGRCFISSRIYVTINGVRVDDRIHWTHREHNYK